LLAIGCEAVVKTVNSPLHEGRADLIASKLAPTDIHFGIACGSEFIREGVESGPTWICGQLLLTALLQQQVTKPAARQLLLGDGQLFAVAERTDQYAVPGFLFNGP